MYLSADVTLKDKLLKHFQVFKSFFLFQDKNVLLK